MKNELKYRTDRNFWLLLIAGEEQGISGLYDVMWEKMYNYSSKVLGDESAASDVIQDLFIHLWEKRTQLPEAANPEGYIFKCLKHAILDHIHSTGIRAKHLNAFKIAVTKTDDGILDIIYHKDLVQKIRNSSERLPIRMREIFVMNRFEEKSVSEIAEELNLSEQTVRNQINIALKKIRPFVAEASLLLLYVCRL